MATLMLTLLAELVFQSADSAQRSFSREMNQYLEERGLAPKLTSRPLPAR
jgi:hypothetical protein